MCKAIEMEKEAVEFEVIKERILFVCKWNIARSQMGASILEHREGKPIALSAETHATHAKFGPHPTEKIVTVMREKYGYDLSYVDVTPLSEELLEDITLIIIFCDKELCPPYLTHFGTKIFIRSLHKLEAELLHYFNTSSLDTLEKAILYITIPDPDGVDNEYEALGHTAETIEEVIGCLYDVGVIQHFLN